MKKLRYKGKLDDIVEHFYGCFIQILEQKHTKR